MKKRSYLSFFLFSTILISGCAINPSHPSLSGINSIPEIPVRDFVANRDIKYNYMVSPDGKRLAWLEVKGLNPTVFYKTIGQDDVKSLNQAIYGFSWAMDSRRILYTSHNGNENTHIYTLDLDNPHAPAIDLTPYPDTRVNVYNRFDKDPDRLLITHNQRDKHFFDLYLLNIKTAKQTLIAKADNKVRSWIIDPDDTNGKVVGTINKTENGFRVISKSSSEDTFNLSYDYGPEDTFKIASYEKEKNRLWVLTNKGRERIALVTIDLSTMQEKTVYENQKVDISRVAINPKNHTPIFVTINPDYPEIVVLDKAYQEDLALFSGTGHSGFNIFSFDRDLNRITFQRFTEKGFEYFLYNRKTKKLVSLAKSPLANYAPVLATMQPVHYKSRDGLDINAYLSLPAGAEPRKLPMVVYVHGGPHVRDSWGYSSIVQFLANRGYAVLQINYRGSTGYGRSFHQAAYGQFAAKMHTDILDGVDWAIKQGFADADKIAIFGESYGGYEALVGLTFSPDKFSCGISVAGMSDLTSFITDVPEYWKPSIQIWNRLIGKVDDPDDLKSMREKSPFFFADRIKKPVLIIHGGRDVRVKTDQAIRFADELKRLNKKYQLWIVDNEGHGISRWNNRLTYFRKSEDFLAQCLGGRSGGYDFYQLVNIF